MPRIGLNSQILFLSSSVSWRVIDHDEGSREVEIQWVKHHNSLMSTHGDVTNDDERIAHDLAILAGAAARAVASYLRRAVSHVESVDFKADHHDPVTVHDKRVESALHVLLGYFVPGSRVLGEETGERTLPRKFDGPTEEFTEDFEFPTSPLVQGASRRCMSLAERVRWIVDPIDGTANFAAGMPYFNTSIAAELDGAVVAGAINAPIMDHLFLADLTHAWLRTDGEDIDIHAQGPTSERDAVVLSYHPSLHSFINDPAGSAEEYTRLASTYQAVRRPGAAALDLAMVASGRAGAMLAGTMKPWDVAAGIHMVKVAGGNVVNAPMGTDLPDGVRPGVAAWVGSMEAPVLQELLHQADSRRSGDARPAQDDGDRS